MCAASPALLLQVDFKQFGASSRTDLRLTIMMLSHAAHRDTVTGYSDGWAAGYYGCHTAGPADDHDSCRWPPRWQRERVTTSDGLHPQRSGRMSLPEACIQSA